MGVLAQLSRAIPSLLAMACRDNPVRFGRRQAGDRSSPAAVTVSRLIASGSL